MLTTALLFLLLLTTVASFSPSIVPASSTGRSTAASSTTLHYVRGEPPEPAIQTPLEPTKIATTTKPKILDIKSLDELRSFLEEDERPVVIKFFAPWCKTCQRFKLNFDRLAVEKGDVIRNRQKIAGTVRFARVEYGSETARLVTERLQVRGVPTFQVYSGLNKLWEEQGSKTFKGLKSQIMALQDLDAREIQALAEETDDGILTKAIGDTFFDGPDFLNEEW